MLTLQRRVGEEIVIGDPLNPLGFIRVMSVQGGNIQLAFTFPPDIKIYRRELADKITRQANAEPSAFDPSDSKPKSPSSSPMPTRLEQLVKLHQSDPNDPFLTYGVALEHIKAQDFNAGIQWLDKTLALDANYFYAYFQKAKALSQLGEDDQARVVLDVGMAGAKKAGDAHALSEMATLRDSI